MTPAVEGTDQEMTNRSMCWSENGLSNRSGNGKARVSKVTRRQPTEAVYKALTSTEVAELSKRMQEMKDNLRRMVDESKRSDTVQKTEEVKAPILDTAPANFAGNLNSKQECTAPDEQVRTASEAECLTFRKHMGGDTLDAFAPLRTTHREAPSRTDG